MTESLDTLLSGGASASTDTTNAPTTETRQDQPVTTEQAAPQPTDQGTQQTGQERSGGTVPIQALDAERAKSKRYTEALTTVEQRLADQGRMLERMAQLLQPPQQPQQPQQGPDWYQDPNAAALHVVAPHLQRLEQTMMANAQLIAGQSYGADKVAEAEKAFIEAVEARSLDPADFSKVVNAPNRYAAAVEWHKRQQMLSEVGTDPAAFREKVKAELLAELQQQQAAAQPGHPAPVMPSNFAGARNVGTRSGPAWGGPTPLGDIFDRNRGKG